jgi:hypothetical protein
MVEVKPNKTFLYIEDNGDGTSTMTISMPEHDVFETAVMSFGFEDMFDLLSSQLSSELHQTVMDNTVFIPNST